MTFSIIGKEKDSLGVGVVSGSVNVRERVPWIKKGVGAVATQGYTETKYGVKGLKLLGKGFSPEEALKNLIKEDVGSDKRQVGIMSWGGKKVVHTGSSCPKEHSSGINKECVAIGNMLQDKRTVSEMIKSFEYTNKGIVLRIIKALEAGAKMGGDRRGNQTAALVIKGNEDVDISVKIHENPIEELKKKYDR